MMMNPHPRPSTPPPRGDPPRAWPRTHARTQGNGERIRDLHSPSLVQAIPSSPADCGALRSVQRSVTVTTRGLGAERCEVIGNAGAGWPRCRSTTWLGVRILQVRRARLHASRQREQPNGRARAELTQICAPSRHRSPPGLWTYTVSLCQAAA